MAPHFKIWKLTHSQEPNYHRSRSPTPAALVKRGSWRSIIWHPQFPKCLNWHQSWHRKTQPCWLIAFAFFLTHTSFMAQQWKQLNWESGRGWSKSSGGGQTKDRNIGAVRDLTRWYCAYFGNHTLSRKESVLPPRWSKYVQTNTLFVYYSICIVS